MDTKLNIMKDIFISDERNGTTPATITARQGRIISNQDQHRLTLRLSDGNIHRQPLNKQQLAYQTISFTNYDINLDFGSQLNSKKLRRSRFELSWQELNDKIEQTSPGRHKFEMLVEKHQRIVVAFAPLVLVLIGVPLGLQSQRSGKGAGFTLGLIVFMFYYLLLISAITIATEGLLPAAIIMWLPNVIFLLGGMWFLHRTATEHPVNLMVIPQKLTGLLRNNFKKDQN